MWKALNVEVRLYVEDSVANVGLNYFSGAAIGLSDGFSDAAFEAVAEDKMIPSGAMVFGGEVYTGWMTHWG